MAKAPKAVKKSKKLTTAKKLQKNTTLMTKISLLSNRFPTSN
jgi:hypothetical protein